MIRNSSAGNFYVTEDERVIHMAAIGAMSYINQYNRTNTATQRTMQTIATGSMHPTAAYGASEYAIAARYDSNIGATRQSVQNTQNIGEMIRTAAGATQNTVSALTTIKDLLINAANDSNGTTDRAALQENINQLVGQINENAYVEYNGQRVVDGSRENLTLAGIDGYENFNMGNIRASALGLTDAQGNVTIDATTVESANASLAIVDNALDYARVQNDSLHFMEDYVTEGVSLNEALDAATTQGAQLSRLEYQQANYTTMEENMLAARSTIDDADMAQQITQMRNQQIQEQLAQFAIRASNQNQQNAQAGALGMVR